MRREKEHLCTSNAVARTMSDVTVPILLAALFGAVFGGRVYIAIVIILVRLNKGPLFTRREAIISGGLLLAVALAIVAAPLATSLETVPRLASVFLGAFVAGAAIQQLWTCWKVTSPGKTR